MREKWARYIVLLTGALVILLAAMFARIQNPPAPSIAVEKADRPALPTARPDYDAETQTLLATGRRVFEAQGCMACHAVAGKGNPRSPLDGIGERRTAEAIRQWIIAPADLKDQLPAWAFQAKQAYRNLPAEDLTALVAYLQNLPPPAR